MGRPKITQCVGVLRNILLPTFSIDGMLSIVNVLGVSGIVVRPLPLIMKIY